MELRRLLLALHPKFWCSRRGAFCETVMIFY
jgi:hypothetical protein